MASRNTASSVCYHLTVGDSGFVVRCLKLLWKANLLNGHTATLRPIVEKAYKRRRISYDEMFIVRKLLRQYHVEQLPKLLLDAEVKEGA